MHYMILMSEKMTSQKKLGEIKSVPYNKPLFCKTNTQKTVAKVKHLRTEEKTSFVYLCMGKEITALVISKHIYCKNWCIE
jgi:hypothetical protein